MHSVDNMMKYSLWSVERSTSVWRSVRGWRLWSYKRKKVSEIQFKTIVLFHIVYIYTERARHSDKLTEYLQLAGLNPEIQMKDPIINIYNLDYIRLYNLLKQTTHLVHCLKKLLINLTDFLLVYHYFYYLSFSRWKVQRWRPAGAAVHLQ